jgi:hypothetical protein
MNLDECFISRADFESRLKQCIDVTVDRLSDKPESLIPQLVIVGKSMSGEVGLTVCMLAVDFNEDNEKRGTLFGMGYKFYENEEVPLAIFLATEAWLSHKKGMEPRQDPDKEEVIVIFGLSWNGEHQSMVHIPVSRENGKLIAGAVQTHEADGKVECFLLRHFFQGFVAHWAEKVGLRDAAENKP